MSEENTPQTVEQRLIEVVLKELPINREQITPEASFTKDLGADSLTSVEILFALEEEFDVEIPDSVFEEKEDVTVKGMVEKITKILDERAAKTAE